MSATTAGAPHATDFIKFYAMETDTGEYAFQSIGAGGGAELILVPTAVPFLFYGTLGITLIAGVAHFWIGTEGGHQIYLPSLSFTYSGGTLDRAGVIVANNSVVTPGNMIVGADFLRFSDSAISI
jgi:hypothetical protein